MSGRARRWLPAPVASGLLALLWLFLQNSAAPGQVILAVLVGLAVPALLREVLPGEARRIDAWRLARFAPVVLADIVTSNVVAIRQVLGPAGRLRPRFVTVPLSLEDERTITLLANTVSLTPGTVSAEVSEDRRSLVVHCLSTRDPEALVRTIKDRYEKPIGEMLR